MKNRTLITASLAAAVLLALGLSACSPAADAGGEAGPDLGTLESGVLKIGTTGDSKPYSYTEDGELVGFEVEIARAIAEQIGLEPRFVQKEFSTLLPGVAAGSLDVVAAATSVTPEREKIVDFSDTYYIGYMSILVDADSGITDDVDSLEGKRIGMIQGTLEVQYATAEYTDSEIVRFPDNNVAVAALTAGGIDGVFLDTPIGASFIEQNPDLTMTLDVALTDFPIAMSMHKDKPKLMAAINTAIAEIIESGRWQELAEKYYPGQPVDTAFLPAS